MGGLREVKRGVVNSRREALRPPEAGAGPATRRCAFARTNSRTPRHGGNGTDIFWSWWRRDCGGRGSCLRPTSQLHHSEFASKPPPLLLGLDTGHQQPRCQLLKRRVRISAPCHQRFAVTVGQRLRWELIQEVRLHAPG